MAGSVSRRSRRGRHAGCVGASRHRRGASRSWFAPPRGGGRGVLPPPASGSRGRAARAAARRRAARAARAARPPRGGRAWYRFPRPPRRRAGSRSSTSGSTSCFRAARAAQQSAPHTVLHGVGWKTRFRFLTVSCGQTKVVECLAVGGQYRARSRARAARWPERGRVDGRAKPRAATSTIRSRALVARLSRAMSVADKPATSVAWQHVRVLSFDLDDVSIISAGWPSAPLGSGRVAGCTRRSPLAVAGAAGPGPGARRSVRCHGR
jgi:hypothetical protein